MADHIDPDEAAFDASHLDDPEFADLRAALEGLSFLRADAVDAFAVPMPDTVRERLDSVIAGESAARAATAAATAGTVVPLSAAPSARRPSLTIRWGGGLVAASLVVLAVGLTIGNQGSTGGDAAVVAGEAGVSAPPIALSTSPLATSPLTKAAPEAAAGADAIVSAAQPAKLVMASDIKYTEAGLSGQVTTLLDRIGVHSAREAASLKAEPMALPIDGGFTASWDALRDCLTWLAESPRVQALVVDRSTFEGSAAGVIVAPASDVDPATSAVPDATVPSPMGAMDVWVVDPACPHKVNGIMEQMAYAWKQ